MLGAAHRGVAPPVLRVLETSMGLVEAKCLAVAAELGIADAVASKPLQVADLAARVGADEDALARLLRMLASKGYFRRDRSARWRNTAASELLRSDHPDSARSWVRFVGSQWHGEIWNRAEHSFRTGESATAAALGAPFFEWLGAHPDAEALFDDSMRETSRLVGPALAATYDFGPVRRVCDVGGGNGALLAQLLALHPHLRGVLLDRPSVVAGAAAVLDAQGVAARCEVEGGDFFDEVPGGCDRYLLKSILHDWDDESCVKILGNVERAMPDGARVLVLDAIVPDNGVAHPVYTFDLLMLVLTGAGRERTAAQWRALFASSGLRVERSLDIGVLVVQELVRT